MTGKQSLAQSRRSTREVLEDHLAQRRRHHLGVDVDRNYSEDLLVLTKQGVFHGKDGIRSTAQNLHANLPDAEYQYEMLEVSDDYGLLGWSAKARNGSFTCHGADGFRVRDGLIVVQWIHYEVSRGPPDGE